MKNKQKLTILKKIANDSRIDSDTLDVVVSSGKVTLQGKVSSYFAKKCAEVDAWRVNGVKSVNNLIEVNKQKNNIKQKLSDKKLSDYIKLIIGLHSSLKNESIDVKVKSGTVTLRGEVDAYWKKIKAESVIEELDGVVEIQNQIAIVHTDQVEDSTLSERIVNNIKNSFGSIPEGLNINVEDSNVILTGNVSSWSQREKIYDCVLYTLGINNITDKMEVKIL